MTALPNPFLNSTVIPEPPAVASTADSACRLQNVARPDATAERDPHPISEPSMTNGGDQETPASAPSKNPDVGVLAKCNCEYAYCEDFDRPDCRAKAAGLDPWPDDVGVLADRIDWHEFFEAVMDERIVLFELYDEVPLFIRDGDHLRRWEA